MYWIKLRIICQIIVLLLQITKTLNFTKEVQLTNQLYKKLAELGINE